MQVQVNSSNQIEGGVELQEWIGSTVVDRVDRFEDLLTRIEVHVSDENADKAGADDKRCQIEFRPKGHPAMSVSHKAESLDLAVSGAADKMRNALENLTGKLDAKVMSTGQLEAPLDGVASTERADALLEEEFLTRQAALDEKK
ncbi:HPF/RaiA family ribosome-associated protein [Stutzerimonas tarimensis]|uniref:HPF/RaiA family ribosome-associated protein n=1 Tax=Stutzerimonas tarimensis TaxID=1507735 RepID=A0ABV7T5H1_9GAMM